MNTEAALKDYGITSGDFGGNVDAFDEISRTGLTQNYNVAVSGGTENGRYRLSVGYLDQEGIIKDFPTEEDIGQSKY